MLWRKLVTDLSRSPLSALIVAVAVALATTVAAAGIGIGAQAWGATDVLLRDTRAPHLAQMHAGDLDPAAIDAFADGHPAVVQHQVSSMVSLDATTLWLTEDRPESASTIEYSALTQHRAMDLLLDLEGRPAQVGPGEVGVPVALARDRDIRVGDTVRVGDLELRVSTLLRDGLMNTTLTSSQRLLVSEADLPAIRATASGAEWLISFRLTDPGEADRVLEAYLRAGLPANGPAVTTPLLRVMASLSDGLVAGATLVVGALLACVAALVLALSVRIAVQADLTEIGSLRAIGVPGRTLRRLYLTRHLAVVTAGAVLGCGASLALLPALTTAARERTGGGALGPALPLVAAVGLLAVLGGLVVAHRALRPALTRPVLDVMRGATTVQPAGRRRGSGTWLPGGVRLGLAQVRSAPGVHLTWAVIALAATLLATLPLSLLATASHRDFYAQTGLATSDVHISLRGSVDEARNTALAEALAADPHVARFVLLETRRVEVRDADGAWSGLAVETGDHTAFPLVYSTGRPPVAGSEAALSTLQADDLAVGVGDSLVVRDGPQNLTLTIVGVYDDITNGGRSAKATLPSEVGTPLWTTAPLDVRPGVNPRLVADHYATAAAPARVTDVESAREEMLGPILRALGTIALVAGVGAVALVALVSALLLQLFLARALVGRSVLQAIGVPLGALRQAMATRVALPVLVCALVGVVASAPAGSLVIGLAGSLLGAPSLQLRPDLAGTALTCLLLVGVAALPAAWMVRRVRGVDVARVIAGESV